MNERELLEKDMMISYTALREYDRLDTLARRKYNAICNKMRAINKNRNFKLSLVSPFVVYLILTILSTLFNISSMGVAGALYETSTWVKDLLKVITFQSGLGSAFLAYFLYLIAFGFFTDKVFKNNATCEYLMSFYNKEPHFKAELDEYNKLALKASIFKKSARFNNDVQFIPVDYREFSIVAQLLNYIENQRADTLKEALNLYDAELKHQQSEESQRVIAQAIRNADMNAQNSARIAETNAINNAQYVARQASRKENVNITVKHRRY